MALEKEKSGVREKRRRCRREWNFRKRRVGWMKSTTGLDKEENGLRGEMG